MKNVQAGRLLTFYLLKFLLRFFCDNHLSIRSAYLSIL